jgi:uncharacterized protein YkwD
VVVVPIVASCGVALMSAPFAGAASTSVSLEGERFTVLSGRAVTFGDRSASGGAALVQPTNGTLTGTVMTGPVQDLVLRLRGDQYRGAPRAVVRVDGRQVAALSVSSTRWADHVVHGSWTAGQHRVQVSFVNNLSLAGVGDRNLRLDLVTFVATAAPSAPTNTPVPTTATPTATATPTPSPTPTATATPPSADATYEARIVELVNVERAKAGLRPVVASACADGYARAWSASMAASGQLVHRSDLGAVMRDCGASAIGENIAYGNVTADQMMDMWMGSTGHRDNILRPSYTHIGVGIARTSTGRVYGTQNLLTL